METIAVNDEETDTGEEKKQMIEIAGGIVLAVIALYVIYVMIMVIGRVLSSL